MSTFSNYKILLAPDSFKSSLTALQIADILEKELHKKFGKIDIHSIPLADGGEGTVDALVKATNGLFIQTDSYNPLNAPISTYYGCNASKDLAFIEVAAASGFQLLSKEERNPYFTSSYGTGILIKDALQRGFRNFIIGLGGSATNDGGAGMLQALGLKLHDSQGKMLKPGGFYLGELQRVDDTELIKGFRDATFTIACDVTNPLFGPNGASLVFGPQKGASPEMTKLLDNNLSHWNKFLTQCSGKDIGVLQGSGAAGGIGAALMAFNSNSTLKSGFQILSEYSDLEKHMSRADLIITGEGRLDNQTFMGKTVGGIIEMAGKLNKKVAIIAGSVAPEGRLPTCVSQILSIADKAGSISQAIEKAEYWLARTIQDLHLPNKSEDKDE